MRYLKFLARLEELQIEARRDGEAFTLDGRLPWVTNLRPEGFHVAAAVAGQGGSVLIITLAQKCLPDEQGSGHRHNTRPATLHCGHKHLLPAGHSISAEARVMSHFMIDVETDGPIPGDYSMISFGAVLVNEGLDQTFYGRLKPISEKWVPEALAVSGHSREETMAFEDPKQVMQDFAVWVKERSKRRPLFISDNNGFDWQFINWYFWHFTDSNPFGHTSTNLGSLYKGLVQDTFQNFKHLRKTAHTHHPVDDAKGNAEALLEMRRMGLKISF